MTPLTSQEKLIRFAALLLGAKILRQRKLAKRKQKQSTFRKKGITRC